MRLPPYPDHTPPPWRGIDAEPWHMSGHLAAWRAVRHWLARRGRTRTRGETPGQPSQEQRDT